MDSWLQWAASTGPSFVAAWSNANVALVSLAVFVVLFMVAAFSARDWPFDLAFAALVLGAILVPWHVMVAMTLAAAVLTAALSFLHRAIAPAQNTRVQEEAARAAAPAVEAFAKDLEDMTGRRLPRGERKD